MTTSTYSEFAPTFTDRSRWTLPQVLELRAGTHGNKIFLDVPDTRTQLSYAEVHAVSRRIAGGLAADGHLPGDRVIIMLDNRLEYLLAWFGSSLAGMAEVPINTAYRGSFLEHQASVVAPSAIITSPEYAARFIESKASCTTVRTVYVVGDATKLEVGVEDTIDALRSSGFAARPFRDLLEAADAHPVAKPRPYDLAAIFFTSGTTGLSKGVAMSHSQLYFFADEAVSLVRLTEDDVYLSVGPLFHGNAQFLAAYPAMIVGARFVLHSKFSASRWTTWIRDSGATVTNLVGVMSDFLWKQPPAPDDADNQLRCVWAVPNPTAVAGKFKERFGIQELVENFGLTEISMPILTPYGQSRPPGAAGLAVADWFDVKLVDPTTDEEVPVGEVGELVIRPVVPWTTSNGYFGMPDKTAEALRNCWFHTGDGLRRDADGWYYFVDRLKDAIRRRGENISSYEVEQAILSHEAVAECAVIGVPADGLSSEDEVLAAVVLAAGATVTPEEFWAFCDQRMPTFAVPRYIRFVGELPKTSSGKLQKAPLRDEGTAEAHDRIANESRH